jgi:hypothetical protein
MHSRRYDGHEKHLMHQEIAQTHQVYASTMFDFYEKHSVLWQKVAYFLTGIWVALII